jgi:hypothetical protein
MARIDPEDAISIYKVYGIIPDGEPPRDCLSMQRAADYLEIEDETNGLNAL